MLLIDFSEYKNWNPFITEIEGVLIADGQLKVVIQPPGKKPMIFKPMIFKPRIKKIDTNVELRWIGKFLGNIFLS